MQFTAIILNAKCITAAIKSVNMRWKECHLLFLMVRIVHTHFLI